MGVEIIMLFKPEIQEMIMETNSALRKIGLTDGEVRVYTALLDLGPSSSGPIVKESHISSSKVYPILDRLIAKGLVSHIKKAGTRIFQTTSPDKILELLDKKKQEIEKQKAEIRDIIPNLVKRQKSLLQKHEATVYEGYKGVKTYYRNLLKEMKKGDERLVFGARSGYPVAKGAQYFFQAYHRDWSKKGLRTKLIFNKDLKGSKSTKYFEQSPLTQVRYLSQVTLSSMGIQRDMVDMLVWTKETQLVFVIKSKEVARTFREYFDVLWKMARK
jgi:sugar-specific transcriptional regulator TrmB